MAKTTFKSILLIQPMHEKKDLSVRTSFNFPWGLSVLSSFYQKAGFHVRILDGQAMQKPKEQLVTIIDQFDFDIAGISSFSTQFPAVRLLSRHIKTNHCVPVIVGGPLATYQPSLVLNNTDADVCVIGEGEISGVQLLKHWDDIDRVKGIAYIKNGRVIITPPNDKFVDLDSLPFPDFSLFDMEKYLRQDNAYARKKNIGQHAITVITSRGCPYNCYFCSKSSQKFRRMSPKGIYNILSLLKSEFDIKEVSFGDELFLSGKSRFRELLPLLKQLKVPWGGQARVNLMDREFLDMIVQSGCIGLGYGIESGSQKILDNMNKKVLVDQIEFAMRYTQKLKIPIKVQLIFGYPGEDEQTVQETVELFRRVDHPGRRFNVITPIPGSKLYSYCIENRKIKDEVAYLYAIEKSFGIGKVHVNFTRWPDDEIYPRKAAAELQMLQNYLDKRFYRKAKHFVARQLKRWV